MKTPLLFCLLSALLETGTCVSCEVCFSLHDSCTGRVEVCGEERNACGIIRIENALGDIKTPAFSKACVYSSQCSLGPVYMTFGNGISTNSKIACCVGNACKTVSVTVPRANTTRNGLRCPACYSVFTHQCNEEIIDCTGAQTQCIHISSTIKTGEATVHNTMKGCATESACTDMKHYQGAIGGITADVSTAQCRPAFHAVSTAPEAARPVLPALVTVLLVNVLP